MEYRMEVTATSFNGANGNFYKGIGEIIGKVGFVYE